MKSGSFGSDDSSFGPESCLRNLLVMYSDHCQVTQLSEFLFILLRVPHIYKSRSGPDQEQ